MIFVRYDISLHNIDNIDIISCNIIYNIAGDVGDEFGGDISSDASGDISDDFRY